MPEQLVSPVATTTGTGTEEEGWERVRATGRAGEALAAAHQAGEVIRAEIRGFRRAIEALRDRERYEAWHREQEASGNPNVWQTWTGRKSLAAVADYLESLTEVTDGPG
jgi:hypothetical protein